MKTLNDINQQRFKFFPVIKKKKMFMIPILYRIDWKSLNLILKTMISNVKRDHYY